MLPYICFYSVLLVISLLYRIDRKFLFFFFLTFTLFYSFAINIGPDWNAYKQYFEHMADLDNFFKYKTELPSKEARFEILFHIITFVLTRLTSSYHFLILFFNTFSFIIYYKGFKKIAGKDVLIIFTFFIIFYGNRLFVSTIRQNLSVCFFYYALISYEYDHNKKWFLYGVLSYLFHATGALTFVVILFLKLFDLRKLKVLTGLSFATGICGIQIGIIIGTIVTTFLASVTSPIIARLVIGFMHNSVVNVRDTLSILQFLFIWPLSFFIQKNEKFDYKLCFVLIFFSFLFKFQFSNIGILMSRLRYNLGLGFILFIYYFVRQNNKVFSAYLLVILYSFALSCYSILVIKEDKFDYIPYENVLEYSIKSDCYDKYFDYERHFKSNNMRRNLSAN